MVGLVAAVNGKLVSMDVFASPQLFSLYRDRLLEAAARSAADQVEQPGAKTPEPSEIGEWKNKLRHAPENETQRSEQSRTVLRNGDGVVGSRLDMRRSEDAPAEPIYESI